MWIIMVSLAAGVVIGILKVLPQKFVKFNLRFQQAGIILLLFSMGASIGANKELIYNLKSMGIKALTFTALTCIFSIGVVYFVSSRFMKEETK